MAALSVLSTIAEYEGSPVVQNGAHFSASFGSGSSVPSVRPRIHIFRSGGSDGVACKHQQSISSDK